MFRSTVPTCREIAGACNFALTTVARALRDDPSVAPETKRFIQEKAKSLGWRASPALSRVMASVRRGKKVRRTGEVLAFIIPQAERSTWSPRNLPYRYFEGAQTRAHALGFEMEIFFAGPAPKDGARLSRTLYHRGIEGIVVLPLGRLDQIPLDWSRFAAVSVEYGFTAHPFDCVVHNCHESVRIAFGKLSERGYRKIGLSMYLRSDLRQKNFWTSSYLGLASQFKGLHVFPPFLPEHRPGMTAERLRSWIDKHRLDAVITLGMEPDSLESLGKKVPEQLGLVALNLTPGLKKARFAGIAQTLEKMGEIAVNQVAAKLYQNDLGYPKCPVVSLVEGAWTEGKTLRKVE